VTVRPGAPAYLDIPYSGADIANGAAKQAVNGGPAAPSQAPPASPDSSPKILRRQLISDIAEEKPLPADTEDALFQASDKVHRLASARIKYHETQLRRWRAVAASFAGLSTKAAAEDGQPSATPPPLDEINRFFELMNNLPEGTT
jgi:hypothetical protein